MRVFKSTYKDATGRTRETSKWYIEFRDQLEYVRRLPAFTSKAASEETGRNLDKLVAYHKGSGGQVDPALTRWLTGLPHKTRAKLVKIGLLAAERVAVAKPLAEHVADFAAALAAKGNSAFHVQVVTARTRRIIDRCGFKFYGDLSASKIMDFLNGLRQDTEKHRGMSAQTFNFHLGAIKQFCRWMVKDRRALESPVAHLDGLNVKTDRRRDRRPLSVSELTRLLQTTRTGPDREGMTGAERALLYHLAVETGLRAGELRSLTRASFDLDADPPTVTVSAAYSKRRREDTLTLRPALAHELRGFLATMLPGATAFRIPTDRKQAAAMFRADVEAAGIAYRDAAGLVADFHGLRHTFITNLAMGGVHPKTAQQLARHSTITLTMDRYTHTLREDHSQALDVLPDISTPMQEAVRATGTDDAQPAGKNLAENLALLSGFSGAPVGARRRLRGTAVESKSPANHAVSAMVAGAGSVCTSGGGPGLQNQWRV